MAEPLTNTQQNSSSAGEKNHPTPPAHFNTEQEMKLDFGPTTETFSLYQTNAFHFMEKKKQTYFVSWHTGGTPWDIFLSQKQDQKFNQRAELSQSDFSVCGNSGIGSSSHWCDLSRREGCNWLRVCWGFIASMATLLPYCLGKVKRRERGEATFTQTLPLHYSSLVPECL